MTFEELKAEAKRQGYNLIKKKESVKLLPCACGNKRPSLWYTGGGHCYYQCIRCMRAGTLAIFKNEAKMNWNNADWRK